MCTECQKLIKGAKAFDGSAYFHPECMLVFYAVVFTLISPERYKLPNCFKGLKIINNEPIFKITL